MFHRQLHANRFLEYCKMRRSPRFTKEHKDTCVQYTQNHMHWNNELFSVLFSNEKKFHLDSPDG